MPVPKRILLAGDVLALGVVTALGFITHGETDLSFLPRFFANFIPLAVCWCLLAPWFGLFQEDITSNPRQLWRPVLAMLYAAPLAALIRAWLLHSAVIPIFAIVLGGTSALGILLWRGLYFLLRRKA